MISIPKEITTQCYKTINDNIIYKRKIKTAEQAIEEAKRLNSKPQIFHKVIAYKCALCGFYHVGKSQKLLDK